MPHPYVVPSSDVFFYIKIGELPAVRIETGISSNITYSQTVQDIFAISHRNPIDIVPINEQYAATMTLQSGELHALIDAVNGALPAGQTPYASLLQIPPFTLAKTSLLRNLPVPHSTTESLLNCTVESTSSDANRNDAETPVTFNIRATGVTRSVTPIV